MRRRSLGVVLPYWLDRPDLEALGIAHQASECGFERLWLGEMATFDVFALATAVANSTSIPRLTVGPLAVGVRSPVAIAMGAASVATLTGTHVDVALGASSPHIVSDWHDRSWSGNPQRTRESVTVLRELLGGGRAAFSGRHIRTRGFRLRQPQPDSTISVAAFGPRMTRVAAETADEVVLNLVPPEHIAEVRASIDASAEARGLPSPRLAVWVTCSVEPHPATHHQLASQLAVYLRPPGYGEMFTELGFGSLVRQARSTAGRHTLVPEIPPELPAAVGAIGSGPEVLRRIESYFNAGADHIGLVPTTADDPDGAKTLGFIREHAPDLVSGPIGAKQPVNGDGIRSLGDGHP
ncbi:LLM class F420-dependent oxidoreductase [Streptomyces violaceusniger]|uniref:F420-dependent oxidoreductase n=1 Tax=Streptomyces violaceusniger (strain Tu 4113) TaxID=653045 RepID=G2P3M5_STRV4|nr:LLM class F420-dependent oxidoreductase [Streptomyces violaceusniger]AEM84360.1 putative F420-dependent oxidoreductase [Streptomyces violaceusniger Tu 4113]